MAGNILENAVKIADTVETDFNTDIGKFPFTVFDQIDRVWDPELIQITGEGPPCLFAEKFIKILQSESKVRMKYLVCAQEIILSPVTFLP